MNKFINTGDINTVDTDVQTERGGTQVVHANARLVDGSHVRINSGNITASSDGKSFKLGSSTVGDGNMTGPELVASAIAVLSGEIDGIDVSNLDLSKIIG